MSSITKIPQPRPDLLQGIATMTAAGINEAHRLYTYPLDVQGAAAAFQWLFAYGDGCDDVRPYPGLAYDPRRGGWREWWGGHGWRERESVLPDMMNIVAVLCANHADMSNWAEGTAQAADPDKVERDYHKLRQRHLGATVERAVKLAAAQCAVKDWDTDPDMLGLPDGNCLYLTPTNPRLPFTMSAKTPQTISPVHSRRFPKHRRGCGWTSSRPSPAATCSLNTRSRYGRRRR